MSSRYVPPSKRNQNPVAKVLEINSPVDFPEFVSSSKKSLFIPARSFSSLASEWNEKSENEKLEETERKAKAQQTMERNAQYTKHLTSLKNSYEEEQTYIEERESPLIEERERDEWVMIDRKKARVELTQEEKDERQRKRAELEETTRESNLNADMPDSDWGFRDRRAVL